MQRKKMMLGTIAFLVLVGLITIPSFIRRYSTPSANGVVNDLRQIDAAKQEWALENGITNQQTPVSEKKIAPYLLGGSASNCMERPMFGMEYNANLLGLPPEARLTQKMIRGGRTYPSGTIIRLSDGDVEYILPPK